MAACAGGCAVSRGPLSVGSEDPAVSLPAMRQAATAHRQEDVPALVEALEDTDPAVRLFAIEALESLTGETKGYHFYEPEPQRAVAVGRWREHAELLQVVRRPTTGPATRRATTGATQTGGVR